MAPKRDDKSWFPRFGDIPSVTWTTPAGVNRREIRGHDVTPEETDWDSDSLWWPSLEPDGEDGSTTATPAQQYVGADWSDAKTVEAVLRNMAEALELPGNPSGYHFIIVGALERLWKLRQTDPAALREVERLCWLDAELVRARPEIIAPYHDDEPTSTWRSSTSLPGLPARGLPRRSRGNRPHGGDGVPPALRAPA